MVLIIILIYSEWRDSENQQIGRIVTVSINDLSGNMCETFSVEAQQKNVAKRCRIEKLH